MVDKLLRTILHKGDHTKGFLNRVHHMWSDCIDLHISLCTFCVDISTDKVSEEEKTILLSFQIVAPMKYPPCKECKDHNTSLHIDRARSDVRTSFCKAGKKLRSQMNNCNPITFKNASNWGSI